MVKCLQCLCVNGKPRDGAIHQVSFVFCIFVSTQRDNHQHQHSSSSASISHIQYDLRLHTMHPQGSSSRASGFSKYLFFVFSLHSSAPTISTATTTHVLIQCIRTQRVRVCMPPFQVSFFPFFSSFFCTHWHPHAASTSGQYVLFFLPYPHPCPHAHCPSASPRTQPSA